MKKQRKKITMDVLAGMIKAGTKETKSFVSKEIANLAGMVQRGFIEVGGRFDKVEGRIGIVEADLKLLKDDVKTLKDDFRKILDGLDKVAKHYDAYLKELRARDAEVKRLKRWIEQIAQKVGVELAD